METGTFCWPPRGWKQLGNISKPLGQSLVKDIKSARIFGLSYHITSESIFDRHVRLNRYHVSIDGWEYSILNESTEYPVLSFTLADRTDLLKPREQFISDIRVGARTVPGGMASARRAVTAAIFLIRQIELGQVPDAQRVLRMYHLIPGMAQKSTRPAMAAMNPEMLSKNFNA